MYRQKRKKTEGGLVYERMKSSIKNKLTQTKNCHRLQQIFYSIVSTLNKEFKKISTKYLSILFQIK